jgi:hypothetical protein
MDHEVDSSAHDPAQDSIDITAAVHRRMIPESVREFLRTQDTLGTVEESTIFRRLFPSMREEAQLRFLAGSGKGAVLCFARKIQYVPEGKLSEALDSISVGAQRELAGAIASYEPLAQAVIVIAGERFSKVLIAGGESFPDGLRS